MNVVGWIVVGFVAGAFAKVATGNRYEFGCLGTIVIGVLGGLLGGFVFNLAGDEGLGGFGLRSMFVAFVGACVLLLLAGLVGGRTTEPPPS